MSCCHNNHQVNNGPAQLLELISVKSFLQGKNKENHSKRAEAKSKERVVLKQKRTQNWMQLNLRINQQFLSHPRLGYHIELHTEEAVPFNPLGFDLDMFFFLLPRLHFNHFVKGDYH